MSELIDDGGPAFPPHWDPETHCSGMSYRRWLAGMALQGIVSSPSFYEADMGQVARTAWKLADAVIAAEKPSQEPARIPVPAGK